MGYTQITLVPFSFSGEEANGFPKKNFWRNNGAQIISQSFFGGQLTTKHTDKTKFLAIEKVDYLISLSLTKYLPCVHFLFCK